MTVVIRDGGNRATINESDFDSAIHAEVGSEPEPRAVLPAAFAAADASLSEDEPEVKAPPPKPDPPKRARSGK